MKTAANPVLYDDLCSFCVAQMRTLKRLDWFTTMNPVPMSGPDATERLPGMSREQMLQAIHCVARDGRIYSGARCFRYLGMRIPLLVPIALLLWVPGAIQVAEIVYRRIARNRYVLSRILGCKDGCAVNPSGKTAVARETPAPADKR